MLLKIILLFRRNGSTMNQIYENLSNLQLIYIHVYDTVFLKLLDRTVKLCGFKQLHRIKGLFPPLLLS